MLKVSEQSEVRDVWAVLSCTGWFSGQYALSEKNIDNQQRKKYEWKGAEKSSTQMIF